MDDLNDPRISAYKPQRRLRLPAPPGYRRKLSKAQRKRKALARAHAGPIDDGTLLYRVEFHPV